MSDKGLPIIVNLCVLTVCIYIWITYFGLPTIDLEFWAIIALMFLGLGAVYWQICKRVFHGKDPFLKQEGDEQ